MESKKVNYMAVIKKPEMVEVPRVWLEHLLRYADVLNASLENQSVEGAYQLLGHCISAKTLLELKGKEIKGE